MLKLLLNIDISFGNNAADAREKYNQAREQHSSLPKYETLLDEGWIRETWGRFYAGWHIGKALENTAPEFKDSLSPILSHCYDRSFTIDEKINASPELREIITLLTQKPNEIHHIESQAPEWVAARLWERLSDTISDPIIRLRSWFDRWVLLGNPSFIPCLVWEKNKLHEFREAVLQMLRAEAERKEWTIERTRHINKKVNQGQGQRKEIETRIKPLPLSLIDRALWLDAREFEHDRDLYDCSEEIMWIVHLLLQDAIYEDHSSAPHPIADSIFNIAFDYPDLLSIIMINIKREPILLADLILNPRFTGLATLIIADWVQYSDTHEKALLEIENKNAQLTAFTDAVAIVEYFFSQGSLPSGEIASLITWMHNKASKTSLFSTGREFDEQMFVAFRSEISKLSVDSLRCIANDLTPTEATEGLNTPRFIAALDVISIGHLEDKIDPEPFVSAYVNSINNGETWLYTNRIDDNLALTLVLIITRATIENRKKFLTPLNVSAKLSEAYKKDNYPLDKIDNIVRGLRAHIRVLARAIAEWNGDVPSEIINAYSEAIRLGSVAHKEKGRVGAFAARYEGQLFTWHQERKISNDLGESLRRLPEASSKPILKAILYIDEPLVLAQLMPTAPASAKNRILERISELTPSEACDILSWPEIQARIDALLSIGAIDAAEQYITFEQELKTIGKISEREITQIQFQIRIALLKKDFDVIKKFSIPSDLDERAKTETQEMLDYYKAIAEILKPKGDLQFAEGKLLALHKRQTHKAPYIINLLAARLSKLMDGNIFVILSGPDREIAMNILINPDHSLSETEDVSTEELAIHECNRALLFLALDRPRNALGSLQAIPHDVNYDRISAYTAVTLFRMGLKIDARAILAQAEQHYGSTDTLCAAKAQIEASTAYDARPGTSLSDGSTRLKELTPNVQPEGHELPFDYFVIDHVRSAGESLAAMVPAMERNKSSIPENNITVCFREILQARLIYIGYTVTDNPLGGFTASGNFGERDLIIKDGSNEIAIFEAVVCTQEPSTKSIKETLIRHFQKLFGYGKVCLFFYLIYSFADNPSSFLEELKRIAQAEAPQGFSFMKSEDIPARSAQPPGLIGFYHDGLRNIQVVFLIIDLKQRIQRSAAPTAAS